MNCHQTQLVWDDVRDGAASPQHREALGEHLRCCGKCRSLWKAEEAWLGELSRPVQQSGEAKRRFTQSTLAAWDERSRPGVLGRIGIPLLAAAAVFALAGVLAFRIIGTSQTSNFALKNPTPQATPPSHSTPSHPQFDPNAFAVNTVSPVGEQFKEIYLKNPSKVVNAIGKTIKNVDINKLPELLNRAWSNNAHAGSSTRPADRGGAMMHNDGLDRDGMNGNAADPAAAPETRPDAARVP